MKEKLLLDKYLLEKQIGRGSFARIYKGKYDGYEYALKVEKKKDKFDLLHNEAKIMSYLKGPYIPYLIEYTTTKKNNILVMQLLGKSLQHYFEQIGNFSIKTVAMLAYQMLDILQYIHDRHILHRDIKPDNFLMGINELNSNLYLIDFGLSKKYRSSRTLVQYPFKKKRNMTGTARYGSINALEGMEQGRRDDLEAMGYVLMFLLRGDLPWQGLKISNREERYKRILELKKETKAEILCKGFPVEFCNFVKYAKNLGFTECPDYERLKRNFKFLVKEKRNEKFDYLFDWTTEEDVLLRNKKNRDDKNDYHNLNTVETEEDKDDMPNVTVRNIAKKNKNNKDEKISRNSLNSSENSKNNKKNLDEENKNKKEDENSKIDDDENEENDGLDKLNISGDEKKKDDEDEGISIDESQADKILKEEGVSVDHIINEKVETQCCIVF